MSRVHFTIKPAPVLVEHRPLFKIAQLLLILTIASRGGRSSLARLQLFNWALKTERRLPLLQDAAKSGRLVTTGWGFDPAVPIALRFAVAEGLVEDTSTGYQITTKGESFARELTTAGLLESERQGLTSIGKKVTERMVTDVARTWEG